MNLFVSYSCLLLILGSLVDTNTARAAKGEEPLPLDHVPKAVMDAVKKKFPDAKPQSAAKGTEDNKPYIEVHVKVKTENIWLTCDPNGTIQVVDREITFSKLPKPVVDAFHKKYPKATIREVHEIAEDDEPSYDIALTHNKKKVVATFEANGEFVEETEDDEK